MRDLYPGYDVLLKRKTPSWNEQTRRVIERRLAVDPNAHRFFTDSEWATLRALCERVVPQPRGRSDPVPIAALLDQKMCDNVRDGYRRAGMPPMQEAWRRALTALDEEARAAFGSAFHELAAAEQDTLVQRMQQGALNNPAWRGMPPALFFTYRVVPDVVKTYYAHPTAWNEIGFGGPAGPRGYVRMQADRRDPWEAAEAKPGREAEAHRENRRVGR